jgi:putative endonuclease
MQEKLFCVYIMSNERRSALYIGVTSNLPKRVFEHKQKLAKGFTQRYGLSRLVWYECGQEAQGAIEREKQLKAGSRQKKTLLIEAMNPEWRDLNDEIQS